MNEKSQIQTDLKPINVRAMRHELGWTQWRLAREIGVTTTTISRWESGKSKPSRLAITQLDNLIIKRKLLETI